MHVSKKKKVKSREYVVIKDYIAVCRVRVFRTGSQFCYSSSVALCSRVHCDTDSHHFNINESVFLRSRNDII